MPEFHELSDIFPLMSESELSDLADDIRANGLHESIVLHAGKILDGRNRYIACELAGVEPKFVEYAGDDPLAFVVSLNLKRRHLNESQRAMIAARLANMKQGNFSKAANLPLSPISQSKAADLLSVGERSVRSAKHILTSGIHELAQAVDRGEIAVSNAARIAKEQEPDQHKHLADHQLITQSNSNEWYTPSEYIEVARKVLKTIDLDPASCREANRIVKAGKFYTKETDGLQQAWPGRVWLNPPYGGLAGKFTERLIEQYRARITKEAVILLNSNCIETQWFDPLWDYILCFTDHRINFDSNNGSRNGPTHGSVFVYLGPNEKRFVREFAKFGHVVKEIR